MSYKISILHKNVHCLEKCTETFTVLKSARKSALHEECNLVFTYAQKFLINLEHPCKNIRSLSRLNETWFHVFSLNITIKAHINAKTENCILADELHRGSLQKQRSPELGRDSSIQTMLIISFRFSRVEQVLTYVISPGRGCLTHLTQCPSQIETFWASMVALNGSEQ